jgi:hypothetical protein
MLRLIHLQTVQGAIFVDDIDDGLPNKTTHTKGTVSDPKAYPRDGYANKPKQPAYIPRRKINFPGTPGYIDLKETDRVVESADHGKIFKLKTVGLISVTSFVPSDLTAPAISGVTLDTPATNDVTIAGTKFLSLAPEVTSVHLYGPGVGDVTLTKAQIEAVAPGAVTDTSIIIDSTLVPGLAGSDHITVTSDTLLSNVFNIPAHAPVLQTDTVVPATSLTLGGRGFSGLVSVTLAGAGFGAPGTILAATILSHGGSITSTQIVMLTADIGTLAAGDTAVATNATGASNTLTLT